MGVRLLPACSDLLYGDQPRFELTSWMKPLAASRGDVFPNRTSVVSRLMTSMVADEPAGKGRVGSIFISATRSRYSASFCWDSFSRGVMAALRSVLAGMPRSLLILVAASTL